MKKASFTLTRPDEDIRELMNKTDHTTLAVWALECAKRVLPYFENAYPHDQRPRQALATLQDWIDAGVFVMAVIRRASLDSHTAARAVGEDTPARSAARACGQAVATAHVASHAFGAAIYARQARFRAADLAKADAAVVAERDWQFSRLVALRASHPVARS